MALNCRNYLNFPGHTIEVQISKEKRNIFEFSHADVSKMRCTLFSELNNNQIHFLLTMYLLCALCNMFYILCYKSFICSITQ